MIQNKYKHIYEPEEDSKLLLKHTTAEIKNQLLKTQNSEQKIQLQKQINLCEIGIGSGYISKNLAEKFPHINYFGSDINPYAIDYTKLEFSKLKTKTKIELHNKPFYQGFNPTQKFDIIIFNTPYFPFEEKTDTLEKMSYKDKAIYGGPNGYEIIQQFIEQTNDHLKNNGKAIIIFSSLSNLNQIEKILENNLYQHQILESENSFFEKIHCLQFTKTQNLKQISNTNTTQIKYLASGKHSKVLEGNYQNQPAIIKVGLSQHLEKEGQFQQKLNNEPFMPKLYHAEPTFVIREKFEGQNIHEYLENQQKNPNLKELIVVLNEILQITQRLDQLKINKFEMTNPYKHIYIEKNLKIGFIDFERCIYTEKPKNTTQVLQYFKRNLQIFKKISLELDTDKFIEIGKTYKQNLKNNKHLTIQDLIKK